MNTTALVKKLTKARDAYYNGNPVMSDMDYDLLEDRLRKQDPNHIFFKGVGFASPKGGNWPKVKHLSEMGSLNKAQTVEELEDWFRATFGGSTDGEVLISEKLDGISINLRYEDGKLTQAATRGDGIEGEEITRNAVLFQGVMTAIKSVKFAKMEGFTGNIRGEVLIEHDVMAKHFPEATSPRNTASGKARTVSGYDRVCPLLIVRCYQLIPDKGILKSKSMELEVLQGCGFNTPNFKVAQSCDYVTGVYDAYIETERADLNYDIDGLVIEVNDNVIARDLGSKDQRPIGAVAFKFPHPVADTTLRDIVWQVGNSGRVTPVALFDTVALAGANISRASVANVKRYHEIAAEIGQQVLSKGDMVRVARRNDVIPRIEQGIESFEVPDGEDEEDYTLPVPTVCPSCGSKLHMRGEFLMCENDALCPAQVSGALKRWVKKVKILEWGESAIDALCDQGIVKDIADLYTLSENDLSNLNMGGRVLGGSATEMHRNLHAKKELPIDLLVGSLGIPLCARSICKDITDAGFDDLDKMGSATVKELASVIGPTKARSFVEGLQLRIGLISKLMMNGVTIKAPSDGMLKNQNVCMTGFRDAQMAAAIEGEGGTIKSSMSKKVNILVIRDPSSTSGKAKKARGYGTRILSIDDMWALLGGKP